jgi:hypothetical protein
MSLQQPSGTNKARTTRPARELANKVPPDLLLPLACPPCDIAQGKRRGTVDPKGAALPRLNLKELESLLGKRFSAKPNDKFDVIPGRVRVASIREDGTLEICDPLTPDVCPASPVIFADTKSTLLTGRSKRRKLAQLEKRSEVEEAARSNRDLTRKHSGLWHALSPSEIREVCLAPGSHHILVMDVHAQLYGKLVYHISARAIVGEPLKFLRDFSREDRDWLRIALKHPDILEKRRGQRFMVAHVVATEEALEGRLGMDRAVAYKLAHACMTSKAEDVDFVMGIVRLAPATNYAFKVHERVGYQDIENCLYTYPEYDHTNAQWGEVVSQIVLCDLKDPMQRDLRHVAAHHPQAVFLDLDPLPKPAKGKPRAS